MLYRASCKGKTDGVTLAGSKTIDWTHATTLLAVAVLVGTEFIGAAWAAGWALAGLLQLDPLLGHALEAVGALIGATLLFYFMRIAIKAEPIFR